MKIEAYYLAWVSPPLTWGDPDKRCYAEITIQYINDTWKTIYHKKAADGSWDQMSGKRRLLKQVIKHHTGRWPDNWILTKLLNRRGHDFMRIEPHKLDQLLADCIQQKNLFAEKKGNI